MSHEPFEPASEPRKSRMPCIVFGGCGVMILCVLLLGAAWFAAMEFGFVPDIVVQRGDQIPDKSVERMREVGVVQPNEELLLYYSWGIVDPSEGGCALSDRAVLIWSEDEQQGSQSYRIPYAAIVDARVDGELDGDARMLTVSTANLDYYAWITVFENGQALFLRTLLAEWQAHGGWRPEDVPEDFEAGLEVDWGDVEFRPDEENREEGEDGR